VLHEILMMYLVGAAQNHVQGTRSLGFFHSRRKLDRSNTHAK